MGGAVENGSTPTSSSVTVWSAAALAVGMIVSVIALPTISSSHGSYVASTEADDRSGRPSNPASRRSDRKSSASTTNVQAHAAPSRASDRTGDRADGDHARDERSLRARLERHPNDDDARQALINLIGDRTPPKTSDAYRSARSLLPRRFIEHETRRFLVFSDADANWTRLQTERLEQAHHQFMRFARQVGLSPLPLRHKLICVLFQNQEDYIEFAAMHDDVNARWMGGYYAPQHDRIVFFNVESGSDVHRARLQIAEMEQDIVSLRQRAADARHAGDRHAAAQIDEHVGQRERHLRRQQQRLDGHTTNTIIATTIHEAVHQLAFHTLIQHPHVHYPLWISEGLATAFETDMPDQAFGPAHEHADRRETFSTMLREDRLMSLRELIVISSRDALPGDAVPVVYHQSYALVTWMHRFRRDELREYLRIMRTAPRRPLSKDEHTEFFESAFGNIDRLERAWLLDERR